VSKKQYIELPNINGQKIRKKYYISSAVKHPAKADLSMMIWILKKFCKDGEIVLDPLCGIGGTLIEGMRLFPNSLFIGIELEEKFVKWCNASIKKVERIAEEDWFMKIGKAVCVQGDTRELVNVLKTKVNKIISSPPYAERYAYKNPEKKQKDDPYANKQDRIHKPYSQNPNNIGNLKYGKTDKIVTSPPWGGQVQHKTNYLGKQKRESGFEYSEDPKNIGNLPHGKVSKIITSPPFGQAQSGGGIAKKGYTGSKHSPTDLVGKRSYMPENTGKDKKNISNLPYADKDEKLDKQTYLEAMLVVYQQCFKVLKSGGLMILITKDFIRKGKRIRLGEDTIKLCKLAGFEHAHTYHRKIKNPSFWRILYEQKHPSVEKIDCEDIIILKK